MMIVDKLPAPRAKKKMGRPTKMTESVLKKLEEAFLLGCTDEEACLYAGVSVRTLTTYQNGNKDFLQRKQLLKKNPVLKARTSVINGIETDANLALKFLERKASGEFGPKVDVDMNVSYVKFLEELE